MLKYLTMLIFLGISFIHAETINLDKLKAEKQALLLKLENYSMQKKIIEIQNFIEKDKLKKEKKREREKALLRLKNDLRRNQN